MAKIKVAPPVTLSQLAQAWLEAKAAENNAREHRIAIEEHLAARIDGPDEGTAHGIEDGFDVSVTRSYTRSIDIEEYEAVKHKLPESLNPILFKPTIDMKRLRAVEIANPAIFSICQKFITIKPAKVSVKVTEVR